MSVHSDISIYKFNTVTIDSYQLVCPTHSEIKNHSLSFLGIYLKKTGVTTYRSSVF